MPKSSKSSSGKTSRKFVATSGAGENKIQQSRNSQKFKTSSYEKKSEIQEQRFKEKCQQISDERENSYKVSGIKNGIDPIATGRQFKPRTDIAFGTMYNTAIGTNCIVDNFQIDQHKKDRRLKNFKPNGTNLFIGDAEQIRFMRKQFEKNPVYFIEKFSEEEMKQYGISFEDYIDGKGAIGRKKYDYTKEVNELSSYEKGLEKAKNRFRELQKIVFEDYLKRKDQNSISFSTGHSHMSKNPRRKMNQTRQYSSIILNYDEVKQKIEEMHNEATKETTIPGYNVHYTVQSLAKEQPKINENTASTDLIYSMPAPKLVMTELCKIYHPNGYNPLNERECSHATTGSSCFKCNRTIGDHEYGSKKCKGCNKNLCGTHADCHKSYYCVLCHCTYCKLEQYGTFYDRNDPSNGTVCDECHMKQQYGN